MLPGASGLKLAPGLRTWPADQLSFSHDIRNPPSETPDPEWMLTRSEFVRAASRFPQEEDGGAGAPRFLPRIHEAGSLTVRPNPSLTRGERWGGRRGGRFTAGCFSGQRHGTMSFTIKHKVILKLESVWLTSTCVVKAPKKQSKPTCRLDRR